MECVLFATSLLFSGSSHIKSCLSWTEFIFSWKFFFCVIFLKEKDLFAYFGGGRELLENSGKYWSKSIISYSYQFLFVSMQEK